MESQTMNRRLNSYEMSFLRRLVNVALVEDVGTGDVTSQIVCSPNAKGKALILTREDCIACGTIVAKEVFHRVDRNLKCNIITEDGKFAKKNSAIMAVEGKARSILEGERVALNFMQRLTGIATTTGKYVQAVREYGTKILDTRKTTPCIRILEKYAVRCGGGANHRFGLYDMILIKDNHRKLSGAGKLKDVIIKARKKFPDIEIEVEVESPAELKDALRAAPDWVLLDNMSLTMMRKCVALCRGICRIEASGGITLDNVAGKAATGVDAISTGALTHSIRSVDLTLEFVKGFKK